MGHHPKYGYGVVDAAAAVAAAKALETGIVVGDTPPEIAITAPEIMPRDAAPPVFSIRAAFGWFWAVEVATSPFLFDTAARGAQRNDGNFFASWQRGPLQSGTIFALPKDVWTRLGAASALYYRVWVSAARDRWVRPQASTPDEAAGEAASILIEAGSLQGEESISGPNFVERGAGAPVFHLKVRPDRFAAVELASEAFLLDPAAGALDRDAANYHGSWMHRALMNTGTYQPPEQIWRRLARSQRVYYRMVTSASAEGWVDAQSVPGTDSPQAFPLVKIH